MNNQMDFALPALYDKFLSEMGEDGEFNLEDSGIILYSKADLIERNTTYQIEEWEPDYFMIGQDGDLAFFIKKDSDDTIPSLTLTTIKKALIPFIIRVLEPLYMQKNVAIFLLFSSMKRFFSYFCLIQSLSQFENLKSHAKHQ